MQPHSYIPRPPNPIGRIVPLPGRPPLTESFCDGIRDLPRYITNRIDDGEIAMPQTMRKTLPLTIGAALLALSLSAPVFAGQMSLAPMFDQIDVNGDGRISVSEMHNAAAKHFAKRDQNTDGRLSADERAGKKQNRMNARFTRIDSDNSGAISLEEMQTYADIRVTKRFRRIDTDTNGEISREELHAMQTRRANRPVAPDTDVTLATVDARMMTMFDLADTNRDGYLSREEAEQMRGAGAGQ